MSSKYCPSALRQGSGTRPFLLWREWFSAWKGWRQAIGQGRTGQAQAPSGRESYHGRWPCLSVCPPQLPVTDKMAVRPAIPEFILSGNVSGRTRWSLLICGLCIAYNSWWIIEMSGTAFWRPVWIIHIFCIRSVGSRERRLSNNTSYKTISILIYPPFSGNLREMKSREVYCYVDWKVVRMEGRLSTTFGK